MHLDALKVTSRRWYLETASPVEVDLCHLLPVPLYHGVMLSVKPEPKLSVGAPFRESVPVGRNPSVSGKAPGTVSSAGELSWKQTASPSDPGKCPREEERIDNNIPDS